MELNPIHVAKTELQKLSLPEREERARVVLNLSVRDNKIKSSTSLDEFIAELTKSVRFFQACSLIRKNYSEWVRYIDNPVEVFSNGVLAPILKDHALVFSLFVIENINIIDLNPQREFINFNRLYRDENKKLNMQVPCAIEKRANLRSIMDLWVALKRPLFSSDKEQFRKGMVEQYEELMGKKPKDPINIVTLVKNAIEEFNLPLGYKGLPSNEKEEPGWLYILGLVEDFSCYLAYGIPGKDGVIELARNLFPNWKSLPDDIVMQYHEYSTKQIDKHLSNCRQNKAHLEGLFNCRLRTKNSEEETVLRHPAALKQIKDGLDESDGWKYHGTLQRLYEASIAAQTSADKNQPTEVKNENSEFDAVVDLTSNQESVSNVPRVKGETVDLTEDDGSAAAGTTNNFYGPVILEATINADSEPEKRGTKRNFKSCVRGGELYINADEVSRYLPKELCNAIKKNKPS